VCGRILAKIFQKVFSKTLIYEQRPEQSEGANCLRICMSIIPDEWNWGKNEDGKIEGIARRPAQLKCNKG
jgi:hypothetical protein